MEVITQHQPSPLPSSPSPPRSPAPAPLPTEHVLWSSDNGVVAADEVAQSLTDFPCIIPSWTINSVINAELGHGVNLAAVARQTRHHAEVERKALPSSFRGLEYKGMRYGHKVSRRARSSSNFPNQLSLLFKQGRSRLHVMLFENGSMKMAGARSLADARIVMTHILALPGVCARADCQHAAARDNVTFRVSMFKRSYRLPMELKLEELAYALESFVHAHWIASVEYGVTRSTAIKLYLRDGPQHAAVCEKAGRCARNCTVSLGIFRTGFIMATGRTSAQLRDAMDAFIDFVAMYYDDVVEHTAEDLFATDDDDDDDCRH